MSPLPLHQLVFRYALFAAIATGVNLLSQWPVFALLDAAWAVYPAMAVGTLTGLLTKYLLDKRWIFYFVPAGRRDDFGRFVLYTAMGGFTTVVFWGTEMAFHYWLPIPGAAYWGAAAGLSLGYILKYRLDRRFVFRAGGVAPEAGR
ncbi:MAG: GtrA family protein [Pseudomonadota bacterium]